MSMSVIRFDPPRSLPSAKPQSKQTGLFHPPASTKSGRLLGMRNAMPFSSILTLLFGALVLAALVGVWGYRQRRKQLTEKYGDPEIARRIMKKVLWQGETQEQLLEALGTPEDIDQKILKTKSKEVWKYRPSGKNRFGLKVTLDDGIVVAWDMKD